MKKHSIQEGFIALTSSIIISLLLMTMVLTVSTSSFYARKGALEGENKRESLGLAESCMNIALLRLAENALYRPALDDDAVQIGDGDCVIDSVETASSVYPKIFDIITKSERLGAFSNIKVSIIMQDPNAPPNISPAPPNIAVLSWEEVATTP